MQKPDDDRQSNRELAALRQLMRTLRDPEHGCPWDRAQDFVTIVPHTLEEAYEVAHAIEHGELHALPDELGDLLFQIVFYCQLGEEGGRFDFDDVVRAISDKLVRRHPHVFGTVDVDDAAGVVRNWEALKAVERAARGSEASSELDDVPVALPALTRARKVQRRAARVGFDWPDAAGPRAKLDEELAEFDHASSTDDRAAAFEEFGDVLFSLVNLARHHDIDPEGALRAATAKFERRFRAVEADVRAQGAAMEALDAAELEEVWQGVKQAEKKSGAGSARKLGPKGGARS
ncbi:MAG: nucleoside triphosphate pyrophosphohydrolase [Gammaproteobacteria bacterium]